MRLPSWPENWSVRKKAAVLRALAEGRITPEEVAAETGRPVEEVNDWIAQFNTMAMIKSEISRGRLGPRLYLMPQSEDDDNKLRRTAIANVGFDETLRTELQSLGITTLGDLFDLWEMLPDVIRNRVRNLLRVDEYLTRKKNLEKGWRNTPQSD